MARAAEVAAFVFLDVSRGTSPARESAWPRSSRTSPCTHCPSRPRRRCSSRISQSMREARAADLRRAEPDVEPLTRLQRPDEVAFRTRQDQSRQPVMRKISGQFAPVCPTRLFHVGEVHGVVDMAEQIAIAEARMKLMSISKRGHSDVVRRSVVRSVRL